MAAAKNQPICLCPDKYNLFHCLLTLLKVHWFTFKIAMEP